MSQRHTSVKMQIHLHKFSTDKLKFLLFFCIQGSSKTLKFILTSFPFKFEQHDKRYNSLEQIQKNTVELRLNSGGMKESKTKVTNLQFAVSSQFEQRNKNFAIVVHGKGPKR